jgi:hypothetical protein
MISMILVLFSNTSGHLESGPDVYWGEYDCYRRCSSFQGVWNSRGLAVKWWRPSGVVTQTKIAVCTYHQCQYDTSVA